mmetsp:Transcript_3580/g.5974  ORF Transcript_3580/g.5974 Transcript_3580/m.5974 type:complete len:224 (+) Transcript_3580:2434-3105(+)
MGSVSAAVPNDSTTRWISSSCFPSFIKSLMISFRRSSAASFSSGVNLPLGLRTVRSYLPIPYFRCTTKSPGNTSKLHPPALPTLIPINCSLLVICPLTTRGPSSLMASSPPLTSGKSNAKPSSGPNHDDDFVRPKSTLLSDEPPSIPPVAAPSVGSNIVNVTPASFAKLTFISISFISFSLSSFCNFSTSSQLSTVAYFPNKRLRLSSCHLASSSAINCWIFA